MTRTNKPLVIVVCATPLLHEAVAATLDDFAVVVGFRAGAGDVQDLLRWLSPAAVVVDRPVDAEAASHYAREKATPLIQVSFPKQRLRVLADGCWEERPAEALDTVLIEGLLRAGRPAAPALRDGSAEARSSA